MNPFKKVNIFTFLLIVSTFAVVLRLIDLSNFSTQASIAESTPAPQKFAEVNTPPPNEPSAGNPPANNPPVGDPAAPPAQKEGVDTINTAPDAASAQPPSSPPYGEHAFSAAELDVLQSLSKRRDELDKREQQVGQHEALLKAAEGEVDRKISELNKIKSELMELLNKQQTVQDERVTSLVKIYEGMKPKEAARIFDTLEMDVMMAVISKMSERKSSPILANMDPEKARLVTIKLAEQHKLPDLPADAKGDSKKDKTAAPAAVPENSPPPLPTPPLKP